MVVDAAMDGARTVRWDDAAQKPGWCKLDWVVADPSRGQLANASNVLDPTWEDADGHDRAARRLPRPVLPGGLSRQGFQAAVRPDRARDVDRRVDEYVHQLEHEVWKYSVADENWGKVARRLYNIFRLTGHYTEAAYIRELFDEPTTALYQLSALIRTIKDAATEGSPFDQEVMVAQTDQLIMSAINALEGPEEPKW